MLGRQRDNDSRKLGPLGLVDGDGVGERDFVQLPEVIDDLERSKNSNRAIHKDLQDKRKVACGLEP